MGFHFGRLPFWLSSILVVFHFGCLPFWSSSILVVFHFGRLPFWLSFILVVFHFGHLPFWSSSILVIFHFGIHFSIFEGLTLSKGDNFIAPKWVMWVLKRSVFDSQFQRL